jgi:hypothetical protein
VGNGLAAERAGSTGLPTRDDASWLCISLLTLPGNATAEFALQGSARYAEASMRRSGMPGLSNTKRGTMAIVGLHVRAIQDLMNDDGKLRGQGR